MEADVWMVFTEQFEHLLGSSVVVVERTVQYPYIANAVPIDDVQSLANGIDAEGTYRLFASAYTESTSIEASTGGFQLYERFVPVEESARFRRYKFSEVEYTGNALVVISAFCIEIAQAVDVVPRFRAIPASQPLRYCLFTFSSKDATDEWMATQVVFVVS